MIGFAFRHFVPGDHLEIWANTLLMRLIERSPYESSCSASVSLEDQGYLVEIEFHSSRYGAMKATAFSEECHKALEKAEHMISAQLDHWQDTRIIAA